MLSGYILQAAQLQGTALRDFELVFQEEQKLRNSQFQHQVDALKSTQGSIKTLEDMILRQNGQVGSAGAKFEHLFGHSYHALYVP